MRRILLLLLLCSSSQVFAGDTFYRWTPNPYFGTALEACADYQNRTCTGTPKTCVIYPAGGANVYKLTCGGQVTTAGLPPQTCSGSQVLNQVLHVCQAAVTCVAPSYRQSFSNTCSNPADCSSGNFATSANTITGVKEGDCIPTPNDCIASRGMVVVDQGMNASAAGMKVAKCIPPPATGCTNTSGKLTYNEFDYCQERKTECDAYGGTYGAVGDPSKATTNNPGGVTHVCIVNPGTNLPTCASGAGLYYAENTANSYGFSCVPTETPKTTCNAALYDCNGDGNVDDQNNNGCLDDGIADAAGCVPNAGNLGTNGTGQTGVTDKPGVIAGTPVAGVDPLKPPKVGAGDCDPTSQNYAECTGQKAKALTPGQCDPNSANYAACIGMKPDYSNAGDATALGASTSGTMTTAISGYTDAMTGAFTSSTSIAAPSSFSSKFSSLFDFGGCSGIEINYQLAHISITCNDTAPIRELLGFFFSALTVLMVFNIAMRDTVK